MVEDSRIFNELLVCWARCLDFETESATCGADAKKLIETGDWDLVILDLRLGDIEGFDLVELLGDTRVVVVTGHIEGFTLERLRQRGLYQVVGKTGSALCELEAAISAAKRGHRYYSKDVRSRERPEYLARLSGDQRRLLMYLGSGYDSAQIMKVESWSQTQLNRRRSVLRQLVECEGDLSRWALVEGFRVLSDEFSLSSVKNVKKLTHF